MRSLFRLRVGRPLIAVVWGLTGAGLGVCLLLVALAWHRAGVDIAPAADRAAEQTVVQPPRVALSTSGLAAPNTDDVDCTRQAWPYVSEPCRASVFGVEEIAGPERRVRVVGVDTNAPPVISMPAPSEPRARRQASVPATDDAARSERTLGLSSQGPSTSGGSARAAAAVAQARRMPSPVESSAVPPAAVPPATKPTPPAPENSRNAEAAVGAGDAPPAAKTVATARKAWKAKRWVARSGHRRGDASRTPGTIVRTIEFADGRRVTITRPVGRESVASAMAAVDRAAQRALNRAPAGSGARAIDAGFDPDFE